MKRNVIIFFALIALLLNGCGQKDAPNPVSPSTATEETQPSNPAGTNAPPSAQNTTDGTTKISEDEAKQIALNHAGLTTDQVTFIKSGIDRDNGRENYDVEFYTHDQKEYDYEIDPYTGAVLDVNYDAEYHNQSSQPHEGESITAEDAKKIALDQVAGATTQNIREFKSDYDNGKLKYEGKIYHEQTEYEFEIDGYTGSILEWDVEPIYNGVS